MDKVQRDCSIRLIIALFINLAMLKPVFDTLGTSNFSMAGGLNLQIALIGGAAAVVTLILIARVFWRGVSWQQIAAVLLTPIPVILLFVAVRYWLRSY
jgi:hypothetical protein